MAFLTRLCNVFINIAKLLQPVILLIARLWMANIFWKSGILKIQDFSTTLLLFTDEHPVPFLPPLVAAVFGTFFELVCPILLTIGFATRFATLPLLTMTAVIQFTYLNNVQHFYWAMLLGMILTFGPGRFSVDYYTKKKWA